MSALLEAESLEKSYRLGKREINVLRGVDLQLHSGEMLALLGASGAGKSTLLHLLGLLDQPTQGRVLFDGMPVHDLSAPQQAALRHQKIGNGFGCHDIETGSRLVEDYNLRIVDQGHCNGGFLSIAV